MAFHLEQRIVLAKLVASSNTQFEDKPDMIEANTTYLWQTQSSVDARILCASAPVAPSPRPQSEFGLACVNEEQASSTARLRLTPRRPVVSYSRHKSATHSLTLTIQLPLFPGHGVSSRLDFRSADSFNYIHTDTGNIFIPMSAFSVPGNTSLLQASA